MKLGELKTKLKEGKIHESRYSLDDYKKCEAIILERKYDDWWEVYSRN